MQYKGEVVEKNGGHVPTSKSTNETLGVFRHHCGDIATVHRPKGQRKKHLHYLLCKTCGTDQCAGAPYQAKIRENMQPNIEALEAFEQLQNKPVLTEQLTENLTDAESLQTTIGAVNSDIEPVTEIEPEKAEPVNTVKPIETPKHAVLGQIAEPVNKPITEHIKPTTTEPEPQRKNEKKTALFMVFGALFGGLFALAS